MDTNSGEDNKQSGSSILKFTIIEVSILLFIFVIFIITLNFFRIVKLENFLPSLSFLPIKSTANNVSQTETPEGTIIKPYSIVELPIKSSGSTFSDLVLVTDDLAMITLTGYIKEIINQNSETKLYISKINGQPIKEILPITPFTKITLAERGKPEREGTISDIKPLDQVMVSFNVNVETKEVFIGGIRINR